MRILTNHPGPINCVKVNSSLYPPPETLAWWMDMLSAKGVTELVMLDVAATSAIAAVEFPLSRLLTPALARLTLGFVSVTFGWGTGFSEL